MILQDDVHWRLRATQRQEHLDHIADSGPRHGSGGRAREHLFADPSSGPSGMTGAGGEAFRWELIAQLFLAVVIVLALFAVPAPDTPRPGAVSTSTASAPHPKDTVPTRAADPDAPAPCSDLDYAYEKC